MRKENRTVVQPPWLMSEIHWPNKKLYVNAELLDFVGTSLPSIIKFYSCIHRIQQFDAMSIDL